MRATPQLPVTGGSWHGVLGLQILPPQVFPLTCPGPHSSACVPAGCGGGEGALRPRFPLAFLSSLAVALGVSDADLTKEPLKGDRAELKLCRFQLGLLLVLANAFFFFFLFSLLHLPGLAPGTHTPPALPLPEAGYLASPLGLGTERAALSPALVAAPVAAMTLPCCLCHLDVAGELGVAWGVKTQAIWVLSLQPVPHFPEVSI